MIRNTKNHSITISDDTVEQIMEIGKTLGLGGKSQTITYCVKNIWNSIQ